MQKIKLDEVFVKNYRTYIIIILLILISVCIIKPSFITILGSIAIFAATLFYTYKKRKNQIDKIVKNLDSFTLRLSTDDTILDFPIPAMIINPQGEILWNNTHFDELFKGLNKEKYTENLIKEFNESDDETISTISLEKSIHDKHFVIKGNVVNVRKKGVISRNLMLYFIDKTDYYRLYKSFEDQKDCIGIILIDNYDEVIQGVNENEKTQLVAQIEKELRNWYEHTDGIFIRLDRNKFLISFERVHLKDFVESKFDILDTVKNITFSNKIPVTLSIVIVNDNVSKAEKLHNAFSTLDIALGRGGDQAIVKTGSKYEFYGGKSKEVEKHTKVKARVVAQALEELIKESKNVCIMGHKNPDADCLGSALGIYRIAKSLGKEAYVLYNGKGVGIDGLMGRLNKDKAYESVFLNSEELDDKFYQDTLLVVTDTHKTDYVEEPAFLEKANKIVLIDHHRRSAEFISEPTLMFHEVYASSACELVTEIIQYLSTNIELPLVEAEALYAGILTDTKNFTFKTGVRTFEAAAYLKRLGIDVFAVKKLFDNDIDTYVAVADVIRTAEKIRSDVAIAYCGSEIQNSMQIAAQAADELISLNGIETSFVLADMGDYINISGRSNGSLNVQVVLEKLGGGGHQTVAGAQVHDMTLEQAREKLLQAINETKETND
jgi:c-di-AMP phosphodiesterase-like protein